jgi:mRNA-degrading endonuclease RelE of RelBE toxin-antitoxin system
MPIIFTERFFQMYEQLLKEIQKKAKKTIQLVDENLRHPSLRVHPIQGWRGMYEARVDQKYRLSFEFDGQKKVLRNIDNHEECLKHP